MRADQSPRAWRIGALALLLFVAVATGCTVTREPARSDAGMTENEAPPPLRVAIAGMVTPDDGIAYYKDLSEYVAAEVGRPLRLVHKADYAQVNAMLAEHKLDVAFVCSGPYVVGHDAFGLELVAAPVAYGQPRYHAYIIVPASSDATSFLSLRGGTFAFADPQSNTGNTVPRYMLTRLGTSPEELFSRTFFTYSHDNSIRAVASGDASAAAVDSLIYDYQRATGTGYAAKTRVLLKSEAYAIPPVVVDPAVDAETKRKLKAAFLGVHEDARGRELLKKMHIDRFVEIDDSAYDSIRAMNAAVAGEKKP